MAFLSIVIPTRNESDNIVPLVREIEKNLQDHIYEIVFVDDSTDDTPRSISASTMIPKRGRVKVIHREKSNGLSGAILEGIQAALSDYVIVMDADLQHPPSLLPIMAECLEKSDIVVPSRFVEGGSGFDGSPIRDLISLTARKIGQLMIPTLRGITDPTGGFFGFHRYVIEGQEIRPMGWKFLIDLLYFGTYSQVTEIPYSFGQRNAGRSKMSLSVQWSYIRHLWTLYKHQKERQREETAILGYTPGKLECHGPKGARGKAL